MNRHTYVVLIASLVLAAAVRAEAGTRAKTMRNETRRTPRGSSAPSNPTRAAPPPASRPPYSANPAESRPSPPTYGSAPVEREPLHASPASETAPRDNCDECAIDPPPPDKQQKFENAVRDKGALPNLIAVNSRIAFTSWDFNFSPAIENQSKFFPTYEMDIFAFGLEFSYLTTLPPEPANLFRDLPVLGQENSARNSLMEYLRLAAMPLTFMENPLLKNLLAVEFRKTTKSATITANQRLYYFPYVTTPGLTEQDSDLGTIYYEQKSAGTHMSYNIKERDWLVTLGLFAFRIGYFDLNYAKPYQMDADIYQGDVLIDRRVYLFEGQASGRGLMVGLQNLYFPNWETKRFYFAVPDALADGFFWGLKELGFYWGSGSIRLQSNLDLVEKYESFYQGETGHRPTVSFLRQVFHMVAGYKFSRHLRIYAEYRYVNYSLALTDSYEDAAYSYFLSHAINKDTVQQLAINVTVGY